MLITKKMVRQSARISKKKWACGGCGSQCFDNKVFCEMCESWYHAECQKLSQGNLVALAKLPQDYICLSCTNDGTRFDFTRASQRLAAASYDGTLNTAVQLEHILLRDTPPVTARDEELVVGSRRTDKVSLDIMNNIGFGKLF